MTVVDLKATAPRMGISSFTSFACAGLWRAPIRRDSVLIWMESIAPFQEGTGSG